MTGHLEVVVGHSRLRIGQLVQHSVIHAKSEGGSGNDPCPSPLVRHYDPAFY
jgi:hypothetical protein